MPDPVAPSYPDAGDAAEGARILPAAGVGLLAPSRCACCFADAGEPQRVEPWGQFGAGPVVVAQYCSACFAHAAAGRTRWLAVTSASLALGLSAAAALVLACGTLSTLVQALLAGVAALIPALALLSRGPEPPHTARGAAVWWESTRDGWALTCTHAGWAARLAGSPGSRLVSLSHRPRRWPWPIVATAALAAASVPLAHASLGVTLRVINRSPGAAVLIVDGRHQGVVSSSTIESPAAGLQVQRVAGRRHVSLVGKDGQVLAETVASLHPGVDHLLAVSPEPICFWVERNTYGRSAQTAPAREPLAGDGPVWQLPGIIDSWFAPNPASDGADAVSSGGVLLALRQGRCPIEGVEPLAESNR